MTLMQYKPNDRLSRASKAMIGVTGCVGVALVAKGATEEVVVTGRHHWIFLGAGKPMFQLYRSIGVSRLQRTT
jgi:hypothetical protein